MVLFLFSYLLYPRAVVEDSGLYSRAVRKHLDILETGYNSCNITSKTRRFLLFKLVN